MNRQLSEMTSAGSIPAIDGAGLSFQPRPRRGVKQSKKCKDIAKLIGEDDPPAPAPVITEAAPVVQKPEPKDPVVAPVEKPAPVQESKPTPPAPKVEEKAPAAPVVESRSIRDFFCTSPSMPVPSSIQKMDEATAAVIANSLVVAETPVSPVTPAAAVSIAESSGVGESLMRGGTVPPPDAVIDPHRMAMSVHAFLAS
jgi:hypothetical protein